jgi:exopolysaccharide biosynthesis polyprenyl glycosylphosphotransferase
VGAHADASSSATATASRDVAELFTFALDDSGLVVGDRRPPTRARRLLADPLWVASALVLAALDAVAMAGITVLGVGGVSGPVVLTAIVLVISAALGSYRHRHTLTLSEGDGRYVILTAALVVPLLALDEPPGSDVLFVAEALGALLLSRAFGFWLVTRLRLRWPRRVFIAGGGHVARELDRALAQHGQYGLVPAAFVSDSPVADADRPVYRYRDAADAIRDANAVGLLCAFGPEPQDELHHLVRACEEDRRRVWVVPRMFDISPWRDHIWGIAVAVVRRPPLYNPLVRAAKRAIDLVVASTALFVLSPLLLGIAVLVRVTSPGPVLFRQERLGLRGREFTMLKFRTMRVGEAPETGWTVRDDPRRTPAGKLLRRTSLDELPQLWNVVRGDMSLIGPRPERRRFAEQFEQELPTYGERTRTAGGITGLAQVHDLRGDTSIEERARFDNRYIDQYSLFLDVLIALRTIGSLFRSKQAY